jgi:beta-galactosidase/beta-glucuronidase
MRLATATQKIQYPAYDTFLANVKLEADQNVQRLRHHPSIVILAGNNEGQVSLRHPDTSGA